MKSIKHVINQQLITHPVIRRDLPIRSRILDYVGTRCCISDFIWKQHRDNPQPIKGFTLIELIIYIALLTTLITVFTQIFTSILETQRESEATSSVQQDGRYLLLRLAYDIHRASAITLPALPGDTSSTLILVIDGQNFTYTQNGTNLTLTNNLGTDFLNSPESLLSGLTFQRLGNLSGKNSVTVSFTETSQAQESRGPEIKNFSTTVGIR